MKELYLLRGLPGSGKTTLAESLEGEHFEADMFFIHPLTGAYIFETTKLHSAHTWCQNNVEHMMSLGTDKLIVSNTFTQEWEMKPYREMAEKHGYRVTSIIVENRHGGENEHEVPTEVLDKMEKRFEIKLR